MNRLTVKKQHSGGIPHEYWSTASKEDVVQRLGAYEDTHLEPEEILKGPLKYFILQDGKQMRWSSSKHKALEYVELFREIDAKSGEAHEYSLIIGVEEYVWKI